MKILALIPARSGSKRIPAKNLRPLGGRPLIEWSINSAQKAVGICDVLVSTDSEEIANLAKKAGALVPWLRPEELATDNAKSSDVSIHALDWYESEKGEVDGLLLLQPTSPFRSNEMIKKGIHLFEKNHSLPIIGVSKAHDHPMWCFKVQSTGRISPYLEGNGLQLRTQDLPPAYVINGSFYLVSPGDLRKNRSFYRDELVPLISEHPEEAIDIDTEWDWSLAECWLASHSDEFTLTQSN